jgi:hypothetical protein
LVVYSGEEAAAEEAGGHSVVEMVVWVTRLVTSTARLINCFAGEEEGEVEWTSIAPWINCLEDEEEMGIGREIRDGHSRGSLIIDIRHRESRIIDLREESLTIDRQHQESPIVDLQRKNPIVDPQRLSSPNPSPHPAPHASPQ